MHLFAFLQTSRPRMQDQLDGRLRALVGAMEPDDRRLFGEVEVLIDSIGVPGKCNILYSLVESGAASLGGSAVFICTNEVSWECAVVHAWVVVCVKLQRTSLSPLRCRARCLSEVHQ